MGMGSVGGDGEQDRGGDDTFFAWFFRGDGPKGEWLSGARFSQRFSEPRYELSTFFEDNYAADLLGVASGGVLDALAEAIGQSTEAAETNLIDRSAWYLTQTKRPGRGELFEAAQGGAVEILKEGARKADLRSDADIIWQLRFAFRKQTRPANAHAAVVPALEYETFWTALRSPDWKALRDTLWPELRRKDFADGFRERELRRQLISTMARLGHAQIDLYVAAMVRRGSLKTGRGEGAIVDVEEAIRPAAEDVPFTHVLLQQLEAQRSVPLGQREWGAFDELWEAAQHFDMILDVNEPSARIRSLAEIGRLFGQLLRQQQPVGGMTGQVNRTLVRQFRMPGYPLVLLSTDLLQEGEDLHTFCSDVYHYGLAWTPSAVEQRIGRVDRVRSKTERTAAALVGPLTDASRLQVYYPHLEDTVERLQVRRVLRRMHEFIRLMHEGLGGNMQEASKLNVAKEIVASPDLPPPISSTLTTSFPVRESDLVGRRRNLAGSREMSSQLAGRLSGFQRLDSLPGLGVAWENQVDPHGLSGTVTLSSGRRQPFVLHLQSFGERLVIRCVSPVGRLDDEEAFERAKEVSRCIPEQLGIVEDADDRIAELTVEEEVLLGDPATDEARVAWLIGRVTTAADRIEEALWGARDASIEGLKAELAREGRVVSHVERTQ
jgi:hypothetical protein